MILAFSSMTAEALATYILTASINCAARTQGTTADTESETVVLEGVGRLFIA
jgi:hypothetical protein